MFLADQVILRELSAIYLGVRPEHAALLASCLGVIAYFYVLFGGYVAVFRTDVLQFGFVVVMAGAILVMAPEHLSSGGWAISLLLRKGYWEIPPVQSEELLFAYHFCVATVMGLGFIIASPDAWKRVFLVADSKRKLKRRFAVFMFAGIAPFVLLVPLGAVSGRLPDGIVDPAILWNGVLASNTLFVATALGLIASFLSAFNSAILGAVHVSLIARRQPGSPSETRDFHWLMSAYLVVVCLLFGALSTQNNPYLLGNVLIGPFAVVAGILVGGRGRPRLRNGMLFVAAR